jgi:hypothetical protein
MECDVFLYGHVICSISLLCNLFLYGHVICSISLLCNLCLYQFLNYNQFLEHQFVLVLYHTSSAISSVSEL